MNKELSVHVLFRFSQKTGRIDTTMTSLESAMLQMWALNNTPKTKGCVVIERDSGKVIFATTGTADGFPKVKKGNLGNAETFGVSRSILQTIKDERFDS